MGEEVLLEPEAAGGRRLARHGDASWETGAWESVECGGKRVLLEVDRRRIIGRVCVRGRCR
jgi:hypothetical protein